MPDTERFSYEDYTADLRRTAPEVMARINNDMQALMAQAEETFLAWSRDGLLQCTYREPVYDGRLWVMQKMTDRTPLQASAFYAACIKDTLNDALSDYANDMLELANNNA